MWIKITDRLPDDEHFYKDQFLVTDGRSFGLGNFDDNTFYDMSGEEMLELTHWHELPELPENEK